MKTKHYLLIGALGVALAGAIFTGCKKSDTQNPTDTTAAQDDANGNFAIQDSKNISDGAAKGQAVDRTLSSCEVIMRRDTLSHADSLYDMYFGPTDCSCNDGRKRRGHIIVWFTKGAYWTNGGVINMTFQNYYVNDIGVTGLRTLTNAGTDSAGLHTWNFNANLTLTYTDGSKATWNSSRTNTLTKTGGKWYYYVSGNASGTSRKGATYNITITSPLVVTAFPLILGGCQYIEDGKLTVTVSTFSYPIYVTFGTGVGNCNSNATATINGNTFNFSQQ